MGSYFGSVGIGTGSSIDRAMSLPCVPLFVLRLALGYCRGVELPSFHSRADQKKKWHIAHLCPGPLQPLCCWAAFFKRGDAAKLDHIKMIWKKACLNQFGYRFLLRQQENVTCWRPACRNRLFKMLVLDLISLCISSSAGQLSLHVMHDSTLQWLPWNDLRLGVVNDQRSWLLLWSQLWCPQNVQNGAPFSP